jgi:hypothetical protein
MPRYRQIDAGPNRELIAIPQDEDGMPAGAGFLIVMGGSLLFWLFVLLMFSGF